MATFPNIPVELVLKILSNAANSSRQSAHAICLTSTYTLPIALPALYRVVSFKSKDAQDKFMATLTGFRPMETLSDSSLANDLSAIPGNSLSISNKGLHVKCISVSFAMTGEELVQCMTSCPNIEDIAVREEQLPYLVQTIKEMDAPPTEKSDGEQDHDIKIKAHLRKLTVVDNARMYAWPLIIFRPPFNQIFTNLTHLVLIGTTGDHTHVISLPLHTFPNLSHVAVPFNARHSRTDAIEYFDRAKELLRGEAAHLKMLILHVAGLKVAATRRQQDWRSMPFVKSLIVDANRTDERIYILPINRFETHVLEAWERGARGERSIWDEAVEVLQETKTMRGNTIRRLSIG